MVILRKQIEIIIGQEAVFLPFVICSDIILESLLSRGLRSNFPLLLCNFGSHDILTQTDAGSVHLSWIDEAQKGVLLRQRL